MICEKHCGKMADWTTDAALGRLRPAQEAELLAHVGECDACREAYRHAREVAAAVDRGVEALVSGEPSPYFAARLRSRIAAEPARRQWLLWAPVAMASALAAVALVALMLRAPDRQGPDAVASFAPPSAPAPRAVTPAPLPATAQVHAHKPSMVPAAAHSRGPEVLVPRGQLTAALQLDDALASGRIDGARLAAAQNGIAEPLEVKTIEIAPLEKPAPVADPADEPGLF